MKLWPTKKRNRLAERLAKELSDCQLELEKTQRRLAVIESERDSMAEVIARDRARVQAESAIYATQRADRERTREGI